MQKDKVLKVSKEESDKTHLAEYILAFGVICFWLMVIVGTLVFVGLMVKGG